MNEHARRTAVTLVLTGILFFMFTDVSRSVEFDLFGIVETARKGSMITILFREQPESEKYYILKGKTVLGTAVIYTVERTERHIRTGFENYRFRAIGRYTLSNRIYADLIKIGSPVGLVRTEGIFEPDYSGPIYREKPRYRKIITSEVDRREMVLVPEGKFVLGSNAGRRDESPEQLIFVASFYIDRYEVSNRNYYSFIRAARRDPPRSWKNGKFPEGAGDFPVLVTFHEAEAYARWAKKRLPTELEWEKAARGPGYAVTGGETRIYPWGNSFDPANANCRDFWQQEQTGAGTNEMYNIQNMSLLPVINFAEAGASPYNIVNMSGNAREWTSSWYMPYEGNTLQSRLYGKQYRVLRGGSWFSPREQLRATSREIGGVPNLYLDNTAGFRCVRDVMSVDRKTGLE